MAEIYDVVILGGGPAGYTAALYAARGGLSTLVLEKMAAGGQMTQTVQIDNYPGFDDGIDGYTLGEKMRKGAERFGAQTRYTEITATRLSGNLKEITTRDGVFYGKTVIIATGADHRHLGLTEEESLIGRGVGYCATCDGNFYRNKTVAVVGGGNSAAADALFLSRIVKKVILIHRRDSLRASKVYHEPLKKVENLEFQWNSQVTGLISDEVLTGVKIRNVNTGEESTLPVDGLFISIGRTPATELFREELELDSSGYIVADESTRTNIPGVFAAGDVRTTPLRQIVTAPADGAVAATAAQEYLA